MEKNRFELIMARVDAWADENAGWDCREDAENALAWCLENHPDWSDDLLLEEAIESWLVAE